MRRYSRPASITSSVMEPKNSRITGRPHSRQKARMPKPLSRLSSTSWPAESPASRIRRAPMNWLVTTAPPVASAENR